VSGVVAAFPTQDPIAISVPSLSTDWVSQRRG